jgi:hypothetical protein
MDRGPAEFVKFDRQQAHVGEFHVGVFFVIVGVVPKLLEVAAPVFCSERDVSRPRAERTR